MHVDDDVLNRARRPVGSLRPIGVVAGTSVIVTLSSTAALVGLRLLRLGRREKPRPTSRKGGIGWPSRRARPRPHSRSPTRGQKVAQGLRGEERDSLLLPEGRHADAQLRRAVSRTRRSEANAVVLGVSADGAASHEKFRANTSCRSLCSRPDRSVMTVRRLRREDDVRQEDRRCDPLDGLDRTRRR